MPARAPGAHPPRPRTVRAGGRPPLASPRSSHAVRPKLAAPGPGRRPGRFREGGAPYVPEHTGRDGLGHTHKEPIMQVTHIVNGVDLDRLVGTIDAVSADAALARFQFRARNQWIEGGHNRTTIKDFSGAGQEDSSRTEPFVVEIDEPPVLLGGNRAPNAGEYLLHALAGCLTGTIVYHAAARGIVLGSLECTLEGDVDVQGFLGLDDDVRPGYESIRVTFRATGDFDDDQLAELAGLTRFSPVRDVVSNPVPVAIEMVRG